MQKYKHIYIESFFHHEATGSVHAAQIPTCLASESACIKFPQDYALRPEYTLSSEQYYGISEQEPLHPLESRLMWINLHSQHLKMQ